jgi:inhibitor of cysteine peptidase
VRRFDDPTQAIHVTVDETFTIALAGNPTTGYTWQLAADPRYLDLLSEEFEPGGTAIGAGGKETFRFHARVAGRTEIVCEYRRPWGREARTQRCIGVIITK